jgi:Nodulation protein Z (NodZ)
MSEEKVVLVKGIEGLGDRMRCALTGILYARLTGRRLLVDWSDFFYSADGTNVFPRFFRCSSCSPSGGIPQTDSVSPGIWRGRLHESAWSMREQYGKTDDLSIDLAKFDYGEDVVVLWTYVDKVEALRSHFNDTCKEFAGASRETILRRLLHEDLQLHPRIREHVDQFTARCFDRATVGVHVRYTDFRSRLWMILTKLNALLKREPDLQIFLATDSRQIKDLFEDNYPAVVSTPHWYASAPGLAIHYNEHRPDPMESGVEALVDLYLLAECDYLIIDTNSSFAYVAKLLAKAPDSNIFDVRRRRKPPARWGRFSHRLLLRLGLYSWGLRLMSRLLGYKKFFKV